jgi:uncharacterized membrane protein
MTFWLTVHVAGVILFIGNIITAAFWKVRAELTRNPAIVHYAVKNVMVADYMFTIPGLVLISVSGVVMAVQAGWPVSVLNWLTLSLILFVVTGGIWMAFLIPLQRQMIRTSAQSMTGGSLSAAYLKASRRWDLIGIAASLVPIIILYLMINKSF